MDRERQNELQLLVKAQRMLLDQIGYVLDDVSASPALLRHVAEILTDLAKWVNEQEKRGGK
jgi:hypothetical protein